MMKLLFGTALFITILGGCDRGDAYIPEPEWEMSDSVISIGRAVRAWEPTLMDTVALGMPAGLEVIGDRVFVSEATGHQIAVFDTTLEYRGRLSRPGSGPGELENPSSMAVTPGGRLAVRESGNARISLFSTDGAYLGSTPAPSDFARFGALDDDRYVIGPTAGSAMPILVRPDALRPFGRLASPPIELEAFAIGITMPDDRPAVATLTRDGVIRLLDPDGELIAEHAMPDEIRSGLDAHREELQRAFFGAAVSPYIKEMSFGSPGGLWLLVPFKDSPVLYFDLRSEDWLPIEISPREPTPYLLQNAFSMRVVGDRMFVLTGEQLHVFPLHWPAAR